MGHLSLAAAAPFLLDGVDVAVVTLEPAFLGLCLLCEFSIALSKASPPVYISLSLLYFITYFIFCYCFPLFYTATYFSSSSSSSLSTLIALPPAEAG
jgi:hypothetical protein